MDFEQWPVVTRPQLVRAFRPGAPTESEAPFRTLRRQGWASNGIRITARGAGDKHAAGSVTLFSVLNLDAARAARRGHERAAGRLAGLAAKLEATEAFRWLVEGLSELPGRRVASAIEGTLLHASLTERVRAVALEVRRAREMKWVRWELAEVVAGRVCDAKSSYVVVSAPGGLFAVPRALAHAARREKPGDLVALVTERFDDHSQVSYAVPAIGLAAEPNDATFNPFGRAAPVNALAASDVEYLSGTPAPLKILVPVQAGP